MGQMEDESVTENTSIPNDKDLISESEGDSLCQYFLPGKSFNIDKEVYEGDIVVEAGLCRTR